MGSELLMRRLCSVLALLLVGMGGFGAAPAAGTGQDLAGATRGSDKLEGVGDWMPPERRQG